jgi:hypothetical protein
MVNRDDADPASRMPCREVGGGVLTAGAGGAAADLAVFACVAGLGWGERFLPWGADLLAASVAAGRVDAFFLGSLEELTPEFPDPSNGVRHSPQRYDRRPDR